ncbi:PAS domain-containing protein [Methylobacterium sp. HMF5984]|uniref:hybrid sensor histidine kinase/response regulator n=1 Tax=Methylobacterium sp. HMF5984 TaxID=3367370 RepID=UPI003852CDDF
MLNGILAASPDCVTVLSAEGRLEFMNARGVELNQLDTADDVLGLNFADLWPERERDKIRAAIGKAAGGEIARAEGFCPTARGEPRWWEASFAPFRPLAAGSLKLIGISRDITERVRAERSLRESEHYLDALVRSSSEVRFSVNADWSDLHHLTGGDFIPNTATTDTDWLSTYIPSDDRAAVRTEFERAIRTQSTFQLEHRVNRVDGTVGWALSRAVPLFDTEGSVTGWLGAASDITARKRSETAMVGLNEALEHQVAERNADLDRVWRNAQDLQVVIDAEGGLRAVSPSATRLLGWTPEEMVGRSLFVFTHPEGHAASREALLLAAKQPLPTHLNRYRHKDGTYRTISWVTTPEGGLIFCYGRDVTLETEQAQNLLQAEEALRQSQKMEAIGQLTGGVAHDFNNLLTVIKSSTDLLKRPDLPEERRTRYIAAISNTVDRAARLTGQLLAFARRQTLKPEVFAACDGVRSITEMVGTLTGARIKLVTDLPEHRIFISADPSQFDTALVNMAVNARDAMEGEGQITIAVRPAEAIPAMRTHAAVEGAYVAISLADTGGGIPPDKLDQIFEPFFTTKEVGKGTGLGLSQVFGFAKQTGGDVMVESALGEGTTFTLFLPRVAGRRRRATKAAGPDPLVVGHDTCVLLVEDNADVGGFSAQALIELGYRPVLAPSADEALAELAADAGRFDVVFTDVVMPGMNGVDLAKEIGRLHPSLPVVLTSGYSHVLAKEGTHGFEMLQKPYSVDDLSAVLRRAVGQRPRTAADRA